MGGILKEESHSVHLGIEECQFFARSRVRSLGGEQHDIVYEERSK